MTCTHTCALTHTYIQTDTHIHTLCSIIKRFLIIKTHRYDKKLIHIKQNLTKSHTKNDLVLVGYTNSLHLREFLILSMFPLIQIDDDDYYKDDDNNSPAN